MYIFKLVIKKIYTLLIKLYLMIFKNDIKIGRGVYIDRESSLMGHNLINDYSRLISASLGEYSYVSPFCILIDTKVGRYCSIGPGVKIGLGLHPINELSTSPYIYNQVLFKKRRKEDFSPVEIGHDVWIGANALIMGGIRVGIGAVIGAGAVVTKDVPDYAVVVGCPAKVIKKRFSETKIQELIDSKWWEENLDVIKGMNNE
ncbi:CatB-related O-acetyltransferase [uncultured Pseudoalteromonas sp.]|uniref:CatB-related O-acetyltransferase n=1 Tax=uncultured Pseudoalteromonas sp. TaxID=114053 RepID=UPI0030C7E37B